jgi:putative membrane protein
VLVESAQPGTGLTFIAPGLDVRPYVLGLIGFASTMRNQLRGGNATDRTEGLLAPDVRAQRTNARSAPTLVLVWLGHWLQDCVEMAVGKFSCFGTLELRF